MRLYTPVSESPASPFLEKVFAGMRQTFGFVPNVIRFYGRNEKILGSTLGAFEAYRESPAFALTFFAMLRFSVAQHRHLAYCINFNAKALAGFGVPETTITAARNDWRELPFSEREKMLVAFCLKMIDDPDGIAEADLAPLHEAGYTEDDIYVAADQAARMMYASTLIRAFKVPLD